MVFRFQGSKTKLPSLHAVVVSIVVLSNFTDRLSRERENRAVDMNIDTDTLNEIGDDAQYVALPPLHFKRTYPVPLQQFVRQIFMDKEFQMEYQQARGDRGVCVMFFFFPLY